MKSKVTQKEKQRRFKEWKDYLFESLQDYDHARDYIKRALADKDPQIFLVALSNVLEAHDGDLSFLIEEVEEPKKDPYYEFFKKSMPLAKSNPRTGARISAKTK